MKKQLEYFDDLANTQRQVISNLLNAQKELSVQWKAAINKSRDAFTSIPGLPETPQTKVALNQFNTWFSTVTSNSQSATDEALKIQEYWINTYEKQLEISRGVLKSFIDIANSDKGTGDIAPTKAKDTPKKAAPAATAKPAAVKAKAVKPVAAKPINTKVKSVAKPKAGKNSVPDVFKTSFKKPAK